MGVELYELGSTRPRPRIARQLDQAAAREDGVFEPAHGAGRVGSMKIDSRSDRISSEIGLAFDSPALAEVIMATFQVNALAALYRVRFAIDSDGPRCAAINTGASDEALDADPDTSLWQRFRERFRQRFKASLISWLVPEGQLQPPGQTAARAAVPAACRRRLIASPRIRSDGPPRMEARPTGSGRERSSPNRCDQCRGQARHLRDRRPLPRRAIRPSLGLRREVVQDRFRLADQSAQRTRSSLR